MTWVVGGPLLPVSPRSSTRLGLPCRRSVSVPCLESVHVVLATSLDPDWCSPPRRWTSRHVFLRDEEVSSDKMGGASFVPLSSFFVKVSFGPSQDPRSGKEVRRDVVSPAVRMGYPHTGYPGPTEYPSSRKRVPQPRTRTARGRTVLNPQATTEHRHHQGYSRTNLNPRHEIPVWFTIRLQTG